MLSLAISLAALVTVTGSCGKKEPRKPTLAEEAVEINRLIPDKWKSKFELEPGQLEWKGQWRYKLLLPKGWLPSQVEGAVEPPDNNVVDQSPTFGFNNEVSVFAACGGDCGGVKEWRKASHTQMFEQFVTGLIRGTVLSDQELPNGRLMIFQRNPEKGSDVKVTPGDKARLVIRAWWDPKADRYHICQVTLSDLSFELAPVAAALCMTATEEKIVEKSVEKSGGTAAEAAKP